MNPMDVWNSSWLLVHLFALAAVVVLFPRAPCWMQQFVLVGIGLAAGLFIFGLYGELRGRWWSDYVLNGAYAIEHLAVLFWLFRLTFFPNGAKWTESSRRSHSS